MRTIVMDAIATMDIRTAAWLTTNTTSEGTNAVRSDPNAIRTKAARSGRRLPERSAAIAKKTPRRDAARTPANMRLI